MKSAGEIQQKGSKYTLEITDKTDLERQLIKTESAVFNVETIGIEMPKSDGQLTNVEGILRRIADNLAAEQPARKQLDEKLYEALENIIQRLRAVLDGSGLPCTISLDDPSGNSFIAPMPHDEGHKYRRFDYPRTQEQNQELGLAADDETNMVQSAGDPTDLDIMDGQVYTLPSQCPGCSKRCFVNMHQIHIPHFKEVFIWSTVCDHCGYRSNEVKTGGAVPDKGKRIYLDVETKEDLSRDILKSDTCAVICPDLDLSVQPGTLGGRFTTVEGLLTQVQEQLTSQIFSDQTADLPAGDSMPASEKAVWDRFFSRLDSAIKGGLKFHVILEDPLANSYIQDIYEPEPDPRLRVEEYIRSDQEDDELGLKDMKTEGYENDPNLKHESEASIQPKSTSTDKAES